MFGSAIACFFVSLLVPVFIKDFMIELGDFRFYIRHAGVADFHGDPVEDFIRGPFLGKCLSTSFKNSLPMLVFKDALTGEL